jgi:hypothetical protein
METLIYFPKMEGVVFVLKWNTEIMDDTAIVSMRDLGITDENEPKSG